MTWLALILLPAALLWLGRFWIAYGLAAVLRHWPRQHELAARLARYAGR